MLRISLLLRVFSILLLVMLLPVMGCSQGTKTPALTATPTAKTTITPAPTTTMAKIKQYSDPPAMTIDVKKKYTATIETAKGNIVLELFAQDAPRTVNNFVFLARDGFYNGSTFHRVMLDFMAQGGDPTGTGGGSPGYTFADEFSKRTHVTGTLSMANSGPDTNGCQFFITYVPTPWLDGHHSVFGQVISGMDVLKTLTPRDPNTNPSYKGDSIIKITIEES